MLCLHLDKLVNLIYVHFWDRDTAERWHVLDFVRTHTRGEGSALNKDEGYVQVKVARNGYIR